MTTITTATNINGDLTMGSTSNIILKSDGVEPADGTQLGGTVTGVNLTTTPLLNSQLSKITIVTEGVYLFIFNFYQLCTTRGTNNTLLLNGTNADVTRYGPTFPNGNLCWTGSQVINATASDYVVYISVTNSVYSGAPSGFFTATRIG